MITAQRREAIEKRLSEIDAHIVKTSVPLTLSEGVGFRTMCIELKGTLRAILKGESVHALSAHEARVTELLNANSAEVERRRDIFNRKEEWRVLAESAMQHAREATEALEQHSARVKDRIDITLNAYLCDMKPDHDDSITGFNEAWDIVRKLLTKEQEG